MLGFGDSLLIGFYWGPRAEGLDASSDRASRLMSDLAHVSPYFSRWYLTAGGKNETATSPLTPSSLTIGRLLEESLIYPDIGDQPYRNLGYRVSLSNGGEMDAYIQLTIQCDSVVAGVGNLCLIQVQQQTKAQHEIAQPSRLREICHMNISCWNPDNGVVSCNALINAVHPDAKFPDIGWITYRKSQRPASKELPHTSRSEKVDENGSLIIATDEITIPPAPAQIELVRAVYEVLGPAATQYHSR